VAPGSYGDDPGTGGDEAITNLTEQLSRHACDPGLYPYRDGSRVKIVVGAMAGEPARSAAFVDDDLWSRWRQPAESVVDMAQAAAITKRSLRQLCDIADSAQTIDYLATSRYLLLGDQSDQVRVHFAPVAECGKLRFKRNRTSANEFTFERTGMPDAQDDFPTRFTGDGGSDAYAFAVASLKSWLMDPDTYSYRDRERIRVSVP
jgi:hypothetical protein